MHQVTLAERSHRSLHYANVSFHAAEKHGGPRTRQALQQGTKYIAAEAGEHQLVDGRTARQEGCNVRYGVAQAFGILRRYQRGDLQDSRHTDQKLDISY